MVTAVFPDSSKLQPMPQNVLPNISANANSNSVQTAKSILDSDFPLVGFESASDKANSTQGSPARSQGILWWIIAFVTVGFIVSVFLYARKKLKWYN